MDEIRSNARRLAWERFLAADAWAHHCVEHGIVNPAAEERRSQALRRYLWVGGRLDA